MDPLALALSLTIAGIIVGLLIARFGLGESEFFSTLLGIVFVAISSVFGVVNYLGIDVSPFVWVYVFLAVGALSLVGGTIREEDISPPLGLFSMIIFGIKLVHLYWYIISPSLRLILLIIGVIVGILVTHQGLRESEFFSTFLGSAFVIISSIFGVINYLGIDISLFVWVYAFLAIGAVSLVGGMIREEEISPMLGLYTMIIFGAVWVHLYWYIISPYLWLILLISGVAIGIFITLYGLSESEFFSTLLGVSFVTISSIFGVVNYLGIDISLFVWVYVFLAIGAASLVGGIIQDEDVSRNLGLVTLILFSIYGVCLYLNIPSYIVIVGVLISMLVVFFLTRRESAGPEVTMKGIYYCHDKALKICIPRLEEKEAKEPIDTRLEKPCQDSISSAYSRIEMAREADVDTGKAKNLLREAKDVYRTNEFEDAINLAEMAKNEVTKQVEKLKSRVTSVKKYPDIDFPSRIKLRQRYPLVVRLLVEKLEEVMETVVLTFGYPEGVEEIEITVTIDARDFEIEKAEQKMRVPLGTNSDPVVFYVTPNSVGNKTIRLKFYQNENYNGEVLVDTTVIDSEVDDETYTRATIKGEVGLHVKKEYTEDLRIEVEKEDNYLEYKVTSRKLNLYRKKYRCSEQLKDPKSFMDGIEKELSEISASSYEDEIKLKTAMSKIEAIGMDLYKRLFPEELKRILWENRDEIKSIFIVSDEEWIPWEIIKPFESTESGTAKEDFWCVKYVIGKWLSNHFPEESIQVKFGSVIAYDIGGKLRRVNDEKESIEKVIKNRGVKIISTEPRYTDILDLLSDKEINLFHFACEAVYDKNSSDDSYLSLAGGDLKARDVGVCNLRKGKPIVFVNACESSITGYAVTGIGGFSKAFIGIGSLAFIGTMWKVPDGYALKFSECFYKNLFEKNLSIGEALKKTRVDLRDSPNPMWLAYSLYGFPLAKISV